MRVVCRSSFGAASHGKPSVLDDELKEAEGPGAETSLMGGKQPSYRIRLKMVPQRLTIRDLADYFGRAIRGRIDSVVLLRDGAGNVTGEATVTFTDACDAKIAAGLNDTDIGGHGIRIAYEGEVWLETKNDGRTGIGAEASLLNSEPCAASDPGISSSSSGGWEVVPGLAGKKHRRRRREVQRSMAWEEMKRERDSRRAQWVSTAMMTRTTVVWWRTNRT